MPDLYGAGPVSLDLARGRTLSVPTPTPKVRAGAGREVLGALDRLSLAHWPPGQRILVGSLDGGVGRTTVAGLLAVVLAELPYADAWPPVGLVDTDPERFSGTAARWAGLAANPRIVRHGLDAGALDTHTQVTEQGDGEAGVARPVVIDTAGSRPARRWLGRDRDAVVLLVCRPEPSCLGRAAEALTVMHDAGDLDRRRVVVLVNEGVGRASRTSATLSTALSIRCASVHRLPWHRQLAGHAELPTGPRLDRRLREQIAAVAVDLWKPTGPPPSSNPSTSPSEPEETP